jgi:hypothetical protein
MYKVYRRCGHFGSPLRASIPHTLKIWSIVLGVCMLYLHSGAGAESIAYLGFHTGVSTPVLAGVNHSQEIHARADIEKQVDNIASAIGYTGDHVRRQLGFWVGPVGWDLTDQQIRQLIDDAFVVAIQKDVAVGFHIEDSMFWNSRQDLWSDKNNVEWSDWQATVVAHRIIGWVADGKPILAPPMCYNSAAIKREAMHIAKDVIGAEINRHLEHLNSIGKGHLFMGVIAGWETRMQDDSDPAVYYGYCALHNLGYSAFNVPKDTDQLLQGIIADWVTLWAKSLSNAGIPRDKIYTHIASPAKVPSNLLGHFNILRNLFKDSDPNVTAFNKYSYPGFSVYGANSFSVVHRIISEHGSPRWGVSEGSSISLADAFNGHASGRIDSMESYLAKVFNHGGAYVNLFGWIAGNRDVFASAAGGSSALAAYRKFLTGQTLSEASVGTLQMQSSTIDVAVETLPSKVAKIQSEAPAWLKAHPDRQSELDAQFRELDAYMRSNDPVNAVKTANTILNLMGEQSTP